MSAAGIPAMLYHELTSSPADVYGIAPAAFVSHLDYLAGVGVDVLDLGQYLASPGGAGSHRRAVILTFDDGYASDYTTAYPLLGERGFPATFFVTTAWVGTENRVTWPQLREMAAHGMTIGSHGVTHRYLSLLSQAEARRELIDSKDRLEQELGRPVQFLALPGGRWASWLRPLLRDAGYAGVCTSRVGVNRRGRDDYLVRRLALRGPTAGRFPALVEQRAPALVRESVVAGLKTALRSALGTRGYETLRRHLVKG